MLFRAFALGLLCVMSAGSAIAHSKMAKSVPAEGATVKAGLSEIKLGFSKPVRLMLVKVRNAGAREDVKPDFKPSATFETTFPFKVPPLGAGPHQVTWTAVAKDGHVMKGTLSFEVKE